MPESWEQEMPSPLSPLPGIKKRNRKGEGHFVTEIFSIKNPLPSKYSLKMGEGAPVGAGEGATCPDDGGG
jgi:hypothetical protein